MTLKELFGFPGELVIFTGPKVEDFAEMLRHAPAHHEDIESIRQATRVIGVTDSKVPHGYVPIGFGYIGHMCGRVWYYEPEAGEEAGLAEYGS